MCNGNCGCPILGNLLDILSNLFALGGNGGIGGNGGCGCLNPLGGNGGIGGNGGCGCGCNGFDVYYARQYALYPFNNCGC